MCGLTLQRSHPKITEAETRKPTGQVLRDGHMRMRINIHILRIFIQTHRLIHSHMNVQILIHVYTYKQYARTLRRARAPTIPFYRQDMGNVLQIPIVKEALLLYLRVGQGAICMDYPRTRTPIRIYTLTHTHTDTHIHTYAHTHTHFYFNQS